MLNCEILDKKYPNFKALEPDNGMIQYIKKMSDMGCYSSYMTEYCIRMLKYILMYRDPKFSKEFEILEGVYTKLKL